jgi:2-methylisocitrate lyase-like PEP mutase family enzyme
LFWIGGIHDPVPTADELKNAGFAAALYPFNATAAVTEALHRTWNGLRDGGVPEKPSTPASQLLKAALELVGMDISWKVESETTN